jgi:hypothetical protein
MKTVNITDNINFDSVGNVKISEPTANTLQLQSDELKWRSVDGLDHFICKQLGAATNIIFGSDEANGLIVDFNVPSNTSPPDLRLLCLTSNTIQTKGTLNFSSPAAQLSFEILEPQTTDYGCRLPNPNITSYSPSPLNCYESRAVITPTYSNISTLSSFGKIKVVRVGDVVTLNIGALRGTTTANLITLPVASIEARFCPTQDTFFPYRSLNNSISAVGIMKVDSDGSFTFSVDGAGNNFSASANSGWDALSVSYTVANLV